MRHERPFQWRRTEQRGNAWFLVALAVLILLAFVSAATMPIPENAPRQTGTAWLQAAPGG